LADIRNGQGEKQYDQSMTSDLTQFTALTWIVGPLIDQGRSDPVDLIVQKIEDGTLFEYLAATYPDDADVTMLSAERRAAVLETFRELTGIDARRKFGIEHNGLMLVLAYASEAIQRES